MSATAPATNVLVDDEVLTHEVKPIEAGCNRWNMLAKYANGLYAPSGRGR